MLTLTITEFRHALALGLGRAVQFVNGPLAAPYSDALVEACLESKARDHQIDGSRVPFLLEILQRTGDPSRYSNQVFTTGLSEDAGHWDAVQFFELARVCAQKGDALARKAMIEAFEVHRMTTGVDDYAAEFMRLDGVDGLLYSLERVGAWLRETEDPWVSDSLLRQANKILGEDVVSAAIADRVQVDPNVAAYVDARIAYDAAWANAGPADSPSDLSYSQLRERIVAGSVAHPAWAQTASPTDLRLAATDLIRETEPTKQLNYLRLFWHQPFPLDIGHLIGLTDSAESDVAHHALVALSNFCDDRVRRLAIALVESESPHRGEAMDLLVKNFRPGDYEFLKQWCGEESDAEVLHDIYCGLEDLFPDFPDDKIEMELLVNLYDRQPCSHCRYKSVERLIELNALPDEWRAELAYDSLPETRALVAS